MNRARQLAALARPVSRSFFLSLQALPAALREPITLAYLLARASDAIADSSTAAPAARRDYLEALAAAPQSTPAPDAALLDGLPPAEQTLFANWELLATTLANAPDNDLIRAVWRSVLSGQLLDVARDAAGSPLQPPAFPAVLDYAQRVAGAVGEFWSRLGERRLRRFARLPLERMVALGRQYGVALQLVNILRDRARDSDRGRVYLAEAAAGAALEAIRAGLDAGRAYTNALHNPRTVFATVLPLAIAARMLPAAGDAPSGLRSLRRAQIRWLLVRAALYAVCPARTLLFPRVPML